MNQQERGWMLQASRDFRAVEAQGERRWWQWLSRVAMKKVVIPAGGLDDPEFLAKVRPFMRPKETQGMFCARTGLGTYQVLQMHMTRAEIAEFIETSHAADKESSPVYSTPEAAVRPAPRRIILDVF